VNFDPTQLRPRRSLLKADPAQLQGGKKGLLINSRDICKSVARADVYYTAHNGASYSVRPKLRVPGCKAKKKGQGSKKGAAKTGR
jgi:hypothetical protein